MEHLLAEYVRNTLFEVVKKRFKINLPDDIKVLSEKFKSQGHQLYVVGGAVRDALLGKNPKDFDLATDATPDKIIDMLKDDYKLVEVGKSFGVIVVVTEDKDEYEIATFRSDVGKGRRPDSVEFTNIEQDVLRRDLTINALFYDIESGQIVDYVGGIHDLKNGIVKTVGSPSERFDEDRLRILRALRFAGRMGSDLDEMTSKAIELDNSLNGVSPERIRDEFLKGIKSAKNSTQFLKLLERYKLWDQILPGLKIDTMYESSNNSLVQLAMLLLGNDPSRIATILNRLKYTSEESSAVSFLLRFVDLSLENAFTLFKQRPHGVTDNDIKEFSQNIQSPPWRYVNAFLAFKPSVSGQDLLNQGFKGAELGKELRRRETENFKELLK